PIFGFTGTATPPARQAARQLRNSSYPLAVAMTTLSPLSIFLRIPPAIRATRSAASRQVSLKPVSASSTRRRSPWTAASRSRRNPRVTSRSVARRARSKTVTVWIFSPAGESSHLDVDNLGTVGDRGEERGGVVDARGPDVGLHGDVLGAPDRNRRDLDGGDLEQRGHDPRGFGAAGQADERRLLRPAQALAHPPPRAPEP